MIEARDAVVWTNWVTKTVKVTGPQISRSQLRIQEPGLWGDPIGAAYGSWQNATNDERARLMTETALDLAMAGFDLAAVGCEFAKVDAFRALGEVSFPMCRALTTALIGKSYENNTMTFEELLEAYRPETGVTAE
jgi:hypothetical protein